MILASLGGAASISAAPGPALLGDIQISCADAPVFTCNIDGTVAAAAHPSTLPGRDPVVGLRVYLDGALVPNSTLMEAWEVNLANAPLNKWTLTATVPAPFGSPLTFLGAAPGSRRIDITGVYLTASGVHEVPLLSNGLVDNELRAQQTDGSMLITPVGADAWGRFDHRLVTLNLPPFHGLTRGDVIGRAAVNAFWGDLALIPGATMNKAVLVVNGNFGSSMQPIADVEGWALCMDADGRLVNPFVQYDGARRVDLVITDADVILGTSSWQIAGDVFTRITLTGTEEVQLDDSLRVVIQRQVGFSLYAPKVAAYIQSITDGSLAATGIPTPTARIQMTSLVVTMTTYRGQTMLSQRSVTSGFYNPQTARYVQATDGTVTYNPGGGLATPVYLYAGASAFDNAQAYHLPQEIFMVVGRQETTYVYDEGAMTGNTGNLIRTVTKKDLPLFIEAAIKTRSSTSDTWESVAFIGGRLLLGDRRGVDNGGVRPWLETMPRPNGDDASVPIDGAEVTTVDFQINVADYITQQTTTTKAYLDPAGALFLFSDQSAHLAELSSLQESTREEITYAATGTDSGHLVTTLKFSQGLLVTQDGPNPADSYLPAATKDLGFAPTSAEFPNAKPASLLTSAPIEAQYISWPLEARRQLAEEVASDAYCENQFELQRFAMWKILRDAASSITFSMAPNFLLRPTMRLSWQCKKIDLTGDGTFPVLDIQDLAIKHSRAAGAVPITTVSGRVYLATS